MPAEDYLTFHDALIHLQDYERANPSAQRTRFHRRAVFTAMQELSHSHHWAYLYQVGRLNLVAPYNTGTIEYDHTGGAYERLVTLTDGTFPAWSHLGVIIINEVRYEVAERINDTNVQLSMYSNPQQDVDAETTYTLVRDRYLLPQDVWTVDMMQTPVNWRTMEYVHPRNWVATTRHDTYSSGTPYYYSVVGSIDFQGCMDCIFYPHPDQAMNVDYLYSRKMRLIKVQDMTSEDSEGRTTSTVSTAGLSTTVTGDGTNFNDNVVGSLLRVADTDVELPTGLDGANPYGEQRMILMVNSATELIVDFPFATSRSNVKYVISDPIDIEYGVMKTAFLRCCENQLAKMARYQDRQAIEAEYQMALRIAKEADNRSTQPRAVGDPPAYYQRPADMPLGADVE